MDEEIKAALNIQEPPPKTSFDEIQLVSGKRYPVLAFVAAAYRVAGWIMLVISVIALFVGIYLLGKDSAEGLLILICALVAGPLIALSCFFIAESMMVLTDIEENTRKTNQLLIKLVNS